MLPKRLDRKAIYESPWVNLYLDKVLLPSGKVIEEYHQLDYPKESVSVLLVNFRNEICFIRSLRYTTQKVEWELPSGGIDNGEDIITAACREVFEETGFNANDLKHIYSYNPSNGMSNQNVHVVLGKVDNTSQNEVDNDEVKEVRWLSEIKIKKLVAENDINDGISLLSLLLYFSELLPELSQT